MAHERFETSYFAQAPVDQVFALFADPERYNRLSPLVSEIRNLRQGLNALGQPFFEYDTVEALHFAGVIPYNNPIHAKTTLTEVNRQVISTVNTRLGIKVGFQFDLDAENGGTRIHEVIDFHMPRLVQNYVVTQAKQVQQVRIRVFQAHLEHTTA